MFDVLGKSDEDGSESGEVRQVPEVRELPGETIGPEIRLG